MVLATGGVGGLFAHTTNPLGALRPGPGHGRPGRARALADLEFVQFHPTALAVGLDPMPLVTEALRGEGALLVDEAARGHGRLRAAIWRRATSWPAPCMPAQHAAAKRVLDARQAIGADFARPLPDRRRRLRRGRHRSRRAT